MYTIKRLLYFFGLRPKLGSFWFSISLAWRYSFKDTMKNSDRQLKDIRRRVERINRDYYLRKAG